jgi:DNA-binding MarR family transcriptional regulator
LSDDPNQLAPQAVDLEILVHGTREGHKLQLRLWLRILSITKMITHEIRRRLRAEFNATLAQFDLLAQLYREREGLRLGELSRRTMVTNGNITGLVDRLEAEGLIVRENLDGDRRVTVARLSKHGRDVFAVMAKAHEGWLHELMGEVDDEAKARLLDQLAMVKRSVASRLDEVD